MNFFSPSKRYAHAKARKLMNEDFFWSPIDEAGPFGSDSGSEAAEGFNLWRKENPSESPIKYLGELLVGWGMPLLDWNELDPFKVKEFISIRRNVDDIDAEMEQFKAVLANSPGSDEAIQSDESLRELILKASEGMGGIYLLQMDNAIIGTGFAQFVLEGSMHPDLKYLTQTALTRQLLPILIERYEVQNRAIRQEVLTKLKDVIDKVNE